MNKKILMIFSFLLSLLFASCWIDPQLKGVEQVGDTYYFEDFDTMNFTIRPILNKTFPDWHWNKSVFEEKYNMYLNNIKPEDNYSDFFENKKNYDFKVIKGKSTPPNSSSYNKREVIICKNVDGEKVYVNGDYFLIVRKNGDCTIFFSKGSTISNSNI